MHPDLTLRFRGLSPNQIRPIMSRLHCKSFFHDIVYIELEIVNECQQFFSYNLQSIL